MPQSKLDDQLNNILSSTSRPQPPTTSGVDEGLEALLLASRPPEVKVRPEVQAASASSLYAKSIGLGLAKGILNQPAGIGAFLYKIPGVIYALGGLDPGQYLSKSVEMRRIATQEQQQVQTALRTKVFSPATRKQLADSGNLLSTMGEPNPIGGQSLAFKIAGGLMKNAPDIVADAPGTIAEMAGDLPAQAMMYSGASKIMKVANATSLAGRVTKHLSASSLASAASSYLVQVRDGESSWMNVVKDVGLNAAFEFVGLPALRKSLHEETVGIGKLIASTAKKIGTPLELAELKLAQIRAGAGVTEPSIAQHVVDTARRDPSIAHTPLVFQAKKSLSEYWQTVMPNKVTIDKRLGQAYGITFDLHVNGQPVAVDLNFKASKKDPLFFVRQIDQFAAQVTDLSSQGHSVQVMNVRAADQGAWVRFSNRLRGERAKFGKMDSRELSAYERNLGQAAPHGTLAESGTIPAEGEKLTLDEPGKPKAVVTVSAQQSGKPNEVNVTNVVTGESKTVSPSSLRTWLYTKQAAIKYSAHSDSTDRHFLVELNAKEAFIEGKDADKNDNYFRDDFFTGIDREGGMNNGPRGFIHADGSVTLSLVKGERLTTWYGISTDLGPQDTVAARRPGLHEPLYRTPSERVAHNEGVGSTVESARREGIGKGVVVSTPLKTASVLQKGKQQVENRVEFPAGVSITPRDPSLGPASRVVEKTGEEKYIRDPFFGVEKLPRHVRILDAFPPPTPRKPFPAGFVPARMQEDAVSWSPTGERRTTRKPISRVRETLARPETDLEAPIHGELTAAARGRETPTARADDFEVAEGAGTGLKRGKTTQDPSLGIRPAHDENVLPPRYAIAREALIDDPAMIDARDAARILIQSKRMDPSTKVRLIVTDTIHAAAHDAPHDWSLEELAAIEPGLFSLPELRVGAVRRGYKAIPDGEGIILRDIVNSTDHNFGSRLEAAAFLQKQRVTQIGAKLDAQAEGVLKIGWMRSFDGEIDGGEFTSADSQQVAMNAMVQNKRAGVQIWTEAKNVVSSTQPIRKVTKLKTQKGSVTTLVGKKTELGFAEEFDSTLQKQLRELEKRTGVPPGTYRAIALDGVQEGKAKAFIYNSSTVEKLRQVYGKDINKLLKVSTHNSEAMVRELSTREAGLDILSAPDPESAILYAYYKNTHQQEAMRLGKALPDEITGRQFRIYDPAMKAQLLDSVKARMPAQQPQQSGAVASLLDPDDFNSNLQIEDVARMPEELNFDGVDGNAPPPIMEPKPAALGEPVKKSWKVGLSQYVMTRPLLFQKLEKETGIPFYRYWQDIEAGRNQTVAMLHPFREAVDKLFWRVSTADARTDVQLLSESMLAGKTNAGLAAKMHPSHVKVAEELTGHWRKFVESAGFTPEEAEAFFADIPQIRKKGGDFKAYVGSKSGLPRMMTFLRNQMERENTPLRFDERETDFHSLSTRLARLIAYEKHLTPAYNNAMQKMEGFAKTSGIPQDLFNNFHLYADSVRHAPDDAFIAANRTVQLGMDNISALMKKAGIPFPKFSPDETRDVMGALAQINYAANLAWNTSSWIQQWMQIFTTGAPFLGMHTKDGLKYAVKWLNDPKLRQEMMERGVAGKATLSSPLSGLDNYLSSKGALGSTTAQAMNKFVEWGTHPFQVGDDFGRVAAYSGKHAMVTEYGQQYIDGKIKWAEFVERSKLDLQDGTGGPIFNEVKAALDNKDLSLAAHVSAQHLTQLTMFMYSRGNNARMWDGAPGRLLGMYSTYPMGVANMIYHLATVGDKKLSANRVKAIGAFIGVNTGMTMAMSSIFNADAAKWTTWQSMGYRGGPYAEMVYEATYVAQAQLQGKTDGDVEYSLYKTRLENQFGVKLLPGNAGANHIFAGIGALQEGDWKKAARALAGLPAAASAGGSWGPTAR